MLNLVGLQVWRGALLLADWLIYNNEQLSNKTILEVGSGVGLTSIVAAMYRPVICTGIFINPFTLFTLYYVLVIDVNEGGILELIEQNVERNKNLVKNHIKVMELNFLRELPKEIKEILVDVEIILAADGKVY